jgi:hypothetical protein
VGLIDWTIRMIVDTPTRVLLETLKVTAQVRGLGSLAPAPVSS